MRGGALSAPAPGDRPRGARPAPGDLRSARLERKPEAPGSLALVLGLAAAQACFAATFRGPRERFWSRMTGTGLGLGAYALLCSPAARRTRLRAWHVPLGLAVAGALYATFQVGDRFARRFVPSGERDIAAIYALRGLRPPAEIAARLVAVIGPAEELFWRGLVQEALMARYGRLPGAAAAALAYAGVHVVTGNFTLFGAAGVAGAEWCLLYAGRLPLGALIVSHAAWDVWIFLLQPTPGAGSQLSSPRSGSQFPSPGAGFQLASPGSG